MMFISATVLFISPSIWIHRLGHVDFCLGREAMRSAEITNGGFRVGGFRELAVSDERVRMMWEGNKNMCFNLKKGLANVF